MTLCSMIDFGVPVTSSVSPAPGRNEHVDEPQVLLLKNGSGCPEHVPADLGQLLHVLLHVDRVRLHVVLNIIEPLHALHHLLVVERCFTNVSKSSSNSSSESRGAATARHLLEDQPVDTL